MNTIVKGVKVSLDKQRFSSKPQGAAIAAISKRIANCVETITASELAKQLTAPNSKTFAPAVFADGERKNEKWQSQQMFALDIDNGLKIEEALQRCEEYNVMPTFIYTSFSHKPEHHKFRMVFLLNEELTDIRVRNYVQYALMTIFPETDKQTKDPSRMYLGGRQIVYEGYNNVISVKTLHFAMVHYIKVNKGKNETREFTKFASTTGVKLINGLPGLETFDAEYELEGKNIPNLSFVNWNKRYIIHFTASKEQFINPDAKFDIEKQKLTKKLVRNFDFDALSDTCQLFRESKDGSYWLYHGEMFGLMTNLCQIEGGAEQIKQILNARKEYKAKAESWNIMYRQIRKANYTPMRCESFCPFAGQCEHAKNMIEQGKIQKNTVQKLSNDMEPKTVEEARAELEKTFNQILKDGEEKGIYIIKAPTGIGKTYIYVNAAKKKNITVAVPTHQLKQEVKERMQQSGVRNIVTTPTLPELSPVNAQKLNRLYSTGAIRAAHGFLRKLADQNDEDSKKADDYLFNLERIQRLVNSSILTTHHRALYQRDQNKILVIDEDIIPTLFPQGSIRLSDFLLTMEKLIEKIDDEETKQVLQHLRDKVMGLNLQVVQEMDSCFYNLADKIEKIVASDDTIDSNILGFLNCLFFVKTKSLFKEEYVNFISRRELPKNKKIIIMSATISKEICEIIWPNAKFFDIGEVEMEGEVIQIPYRSFSRLSFFNNSAEMKFLKNSLINAYNPNSIEISYKHFMDKNTIWLDDATWFGNTTGFDRLNGQNITIVGTPNLNPISYLLFASALGFKLTLDDSVMTYKIVVRNGFRFYYMTYSNNEKLMEIQFYLTESELIQAVGRARALTNNVRVLVLSNLPVPGANIINLDKEDVIQIKNNYIRKQNQMKKRG